MFIRKISTRLFKIQRHTSFTFAESYLTRFMKMNSYEKRTEIYSLDMKMKMFESENPQFYLDMEKSEVYYTIYRKHKLLIQNINIKI